VLLFLDLLGSFVLWVCRGLTTFQPDIVIQELIFTFKLYQNDGTGLPRVVVSIHVER